MKDIDLDSNINRSDVSAYKEHSSKQLESNIVSNTQGAFIKINQVSVHKVSINF